MRTIAIIVLTLQLATFLGWVLNIHSLITSSEALGLTIARAIGIIVFPLGAVLGYF